MFPIKKLQELSIKTRLRKIVKILDAWEQDQIHGKNTLKMQETVSYFENLRDVLLDTDIPAEIRSITAKKKDEELYRHINTLRHAILRYLGAEPSEWDFIEKDTGLLDTAKRKIFPFYVFLEDIRAPFNIGSIMRTSEVFGVEKVLLSPACPLPTHIRASRTGRGAEKVVPFEVLPLHDLVPGDKAAAPFFALETGGTPINKFAFPASGTVLVGSEELGLSPEALALADKHLGRVTIPMGGAKRSLNVSVAFGILMQRWHEAFFRKTM